MSIGLILLAKAQRRQGLGSWALRMLEAWLTRDTPTEAVVVAVPAQNHSGPGLLHRQRLWLHRPGDARADGEHPFASAGDAQKPGLMPGA
ncbi:MAG: hypothetical protein V9H69_06180 [Anaerolineae bacterium]